jgi:hypothetical protein
LILARQFLNLFHLVACNNFAKGSHEVDQQDTKNDTESSVPRWSRIYLQVIRQTKCQERYIEDLNAYIKDEDTR